MNIMVLLLLHGAHESDNICLEQLRDNCLLHLWGVMGSQNAFIMHLKNCEKGWTQEKELDMVYAPIGLDLGAQTPEEVRIIYRG